MAISEWRYIADNILIRHHNSNASEMGSVFLRGICVYPSYLGMACLIYA